MGNRSHIDSARRIILDLKARTSKPILAYSGGKDAIAVAILARNYSIDSGVCDTSYCFAKQVEDIRTTAHILRLKVRFWERLGLDWLRDHLHALFATDQKVRSWTYATRQQSTVRKHGQEVKATAIVFGRRTETNTVKAPLYETADGVLQCHPIWDWTTEQVWDFLAENSVPKPWIYSTLPGEKEGNTPWHNLDPRNYGGVPATWELIRSLDKRLTVGYILGHEWKWSDPEIPRLLSGMPNF